MGASVPGNRYAFIVGASDNYMEGLVAMFNSLEYHGHTADVILIPWKLPQEFLDGLGKYSFEVRLFPNDVEHQVLATAIERFRVAYQIGTEYEAICLLDADMFFLDNVDLFFEIASKGFIVTGSNGMIIDFGTSYQEQYEVDLGQPNWPYKKVHTTAPIFISPQDLDWFEALYNARRIDSWDDFLYLNILGIKMGKYKNMLCMPPYAFTGIHHWHLKVETGLVRKGPDIVLAGTEEAVYIAHGKFWEENYCKDLLKIMYLYLERWNMGARCKQRIEDAHKTALQEFDKYRNLQIGVEPEPEPEPDAISWFLRRHSSSSSTVPSSSSPASDGSSTSSVVTTQIRQPL